MGRCPEGRRVPDQVGVRRGQSESPGVRCLVSPPDRASQYLGRQHTAALARHGLRQSAGRVGNCWDNSVVESFFASLKRELVHRRRFASREEAGREIFAWIGRYNTQRLHSSLAYQTPTEWEDHHRPTHELDQAA